MNHLPVSLFIIAVLVNISAGNFRPHPGGANRPPPPLICTPDSLMLYQDCRMCVCPRPYKAAKCFKKSCDLRTKDSGQCPTSALKLDDSRLCPNSPTASCKSDVDCPGVQLCCFDFCNGAKCVNPVPLDASSGTPHHGRGYQ
ncbi:WAP four-disulfide core domain protein 5 [Folsomia candida]|uniref:Antileukoproteinase n=1 Tax=Folsomia candida TaxID=158441 RepID=A0A226ET83_FOLCA|nr:WAP four-disulfide core domain protein 5 [Folsomia candida]OXA60274.1 Antileukoproteinase [Folsomia candida]